LTLYDLSMNLKDASLSILGLLMTRFAETLKLYVAGISEKLKKIILPFYFIILISLLTLNDLSMILKYAS
jgi:hypothetical protein